MSTGTHFFKRVVIAGALLMASLSISAISHAQGGPPAQPDASTARQKPAPQPPGVHVVRVYVSGPADTLKLVNGGWDVLEARGPDYLYVIADDATISALQLQGFRVEIEQTLSNDLATTETYYGGYRTVAEQYAHLDQVAASYPALAKVIDYGDSWRKVNGQGGNDLKVICITANAPANCALSPATSRPRFLLIAAIHARELTTAEVAYRWIDYLTQNYGTDADVTWLLDSHELWVIPVVNPDGRQIVETGNNSPYLQRKNANNTLGSCANPPTSSNQFGVDLNRNASTDNYGGAGTSTNPCDQTYRGLVKASEPEEQAMESLFTQIFSDTKALNRNDPADANTQGAFITLHSYSNLVLLPYGDATTGGYAPNDAPLRSFAFRMSFYNNYQTGTGDEILYPTTGTTDDWIYGKLGVPGFTFEMGPSSGSCSGFTPSYSCVDSTFWPANRPALLYAAKASRNPYSVVFGPTTSNVAVSAATVNPGTPVTLNAAANDNAYGNAAGSVGRPTTQNIAAAEYYLDTPPWAGGTPITMSASDGAFNATSENVTASVNTTGLADGRHTLYVRGRDAGNNWGPVSAIFFTITSTPLPQAYTLAPAADATVRGGNNANTNYGAATTLEVRLSSNSNNTRNAHIKFDTSSVPAGATVSAKIRLYGAPSSSGNIGVSAYSVANTAWAENTITFNTAPASGTTALGNVTVSSTTAQYYEWDITAYVNSERAAGRNVISIAFKSPASTTVAFNASSKEAASNRPQLVVVR
jgi:hypothetical protein